MSDLAEDIKDFETEPVAARLPTDMTGNLQFGQARQVDESKVIEWQLMKMRQESLFQRGTATMRLGFVTYGHGCFWQNG